MKHETSGVYNALVEVSEAANDAMAKSEAQSLAENILSYHFILCSIIWYDILNTINITSNLLQTENFDVAMAVNCLETNMKYFQDYRKNGFQAAQTFA